MSAEGEDDRFLLDGQHRRLWLLRAAAPIGRGRPLLPFSNCLRVDAVALGKRPQARLTMLYCSTDRRCRCGAAMVNLSHSASFHSGEKSAPPKHGIKHLVTSISTLLARGLKDCVNFSLSDSRLGTADIKE
jgi:hypothetical protein